MDELLLIGAPFLIFLVAAVWAGYSIGKTAPSRDPSLGDAPDSPGGRATLRMRLGPTGLVRRPVLRQIQSPIRRSLSCLRPR